MKKVLCVGMMVCDTILAPVPDQILQMDTAEIRHPVVTCGGDALNVAIGLGKLGVPTALAGRVARDSHGELLLDTCARYGVDTQSVVYDETCPTASSYALVDRTGERHFLSEKSIFARLSAADVPDAAIAEADIVYFGSAMAMEEMDRAGICSLFTRAHALGKLTAMDAALNPGVQRNWLSYLAPALRETDYFFPSLGEAVAITGKTSLGEILDCFRPFSMRMFGVKLGAEGCFYTDFQTEHRVRCPQGMPVVDTTGAGDSFLAGLLCGLARGMTHEEAVWLASCVATLNVGAVGGTAGIPDFEGAMAFCRSRSK